MVIWELIFWWVQVIKFELNNFIVINVEGS